MSHVALLAQLLLCLRFGDSVPLAAACETSFLVLGKAEASHSHKGWAYKSVASLCLLSVTSVLCSAVEASHISVLICSVFCLPCVLFEHANQTALLGEGFV